MTKQFAQGTKLQRGTGDPVVYTTVAGVKDFPFPNTESDLLEVTDHDSPQGRKEYIGGLIDSGEITFEVTYNPASTSHQVLFQDVQDRQPVPFRIQPVGAFAGYDWTFEALVRKFQPKAPVNGVYTADVTLKPTGNIDVATAEVAPDAPSFLTAFAISDTEITVVWSDVAGADTYDVRRSTDEETWTVIDEETSPYTNTGLTAATAYFYQVRSTNEHGDGAWSGSVSATTET